MKANLPDNEAARLAALQAYDILDTLPEQAFDDLTLIAAQVCNTPISLVSLIDENRQWFKSRHGHDVSETPRDFSFCAHALQSPNELLYVPDARKDARFADNPSVTGASKIRFYMGAPLVTSSGEVMGTLCVVDHQPRELTETQARTLQALARQTMAQIELRRHAIQLSNEMAIRVQTEEALRESEARFQIFMDRSPVVAFIKDDQSRYVYINRLFAERFRLGHEGTIGRSDFELWPEIAPVLRERDLKVLQGEEVLGVVETTRGEDGLLRHWQVYKFPLKQGGGDRCFIGGISVDITENKVHEQELQEYQAKLEITLQLVEAQSLRDGLTELHNRRSFDLKMAEEFARAKRYGSPLSLIMLDVDKFKALNDNFGHAEGDDVLRKVAQLLGEEARTSDFVARYGGEEFILVLPNTDRAGAVILAERLRLAVQNAVWVKREVTISLGVAALGPDMDNLATLLKAVDAALYEAKNSGRNCVRQAQI